MDAKLIIDAVDRFVDLEDLAEERFEPYGIYHREMARILAVCRLLGIDMAIESGRARGQSTYVLAKYLGASRVETHSVEFSRDAHATFAEDRLSIFGKNLILHYGNSFELIPRLLRSAQGRRIAILIDGPQGRRAIDLLSECTKASQEVRVGFIHDLQRL